ncbi:DUF7410 domain-containing protein [Haloarchaeobius sp. DT45]|uniref:DUF7410 domain-containing protein n=1 Tax=Haloarchaeobius sp. DT45 TaxID=3446116 RepID=UPI003F6B69A9
MTRRIDHAELETEVPPGDQPHRCPYCDRPFRKAEYRTLHVGLTHYDVMTDTERERFQDAYREESDELGLFRLRTFAVLVLLYFGMLMLYSVVT